MKDVGTIMKKAAKLAERLEGEGYKPLEVMVLGEILSNMGATAQTYAVNKALQGGKEFVQSRCTK